MTENFPNLAKETDIKSRKHRESQHKMNPKRPAPRHIIIKLLKVKDKERIFKAEREKQPVPYKGIPVRLSVDFSVETLQARGEWHDIFNTMEKNQQPYNQEYSTRKVIIQN